MAPSSAVLADLTAAPATPAATTTAANAAAARRTGDALTRFLLPSWTERR
jgi:hypothetical protein